MSAAVAQLVPGRTDAELAKEFKERVIEAYQPVIAILEEAAAAGFQINVQITMGAVGRMQITTLQIAKTY